jgi:hypothetical protein
MNYVRKPNGDIEQVVHVKRRSSQRPGHEIAAAMHSSRAEHIDKSKTQKENRKAKRQHLRELKRKTKDLAAN